MSSPSSSPEPPNAGMASQSVGAESGRPNKKRLPPIAPHPAANDNDTMATDDDPVDAAVPSTAADDKPTETEGEDDDDVQGTDSDRHDQTDTDHNLDHEYGHETTTTATATENDNGGGGHSTDASESTSGGDPLAAMLRRLADQAGISIPGLGRQGSAMSGRWSKIVELLQSVDLSEQLMGAEELSDLLVVATEETIGPGSGSAFRPDEILPPLAQIIRGDGPVEPPAELALLACRCLSNLLEALPSPTVHAAFISSGVIGALCSKLIMIDFIDVAEQSLTLLEKLSVDHPAEILQQGGMEAVLTFIDFFSTSTQRSAAQCVANLAGALTKDMLPQCRGVMPILARLLQSTDTRILESACLALSRIADAAVGPSGRPGCRLESSVYATEGTAKTAPFTDELFTVEIVEAILHVINHAAMTGSSSVALSPTTLVSLVRLVQLMVMFSSPLATHIISTNIATTFSLLMSGSDVVSASPPSDFVTARPPEFWVNTLELMTVMFPPTVLDVKIEFGVKLLAHWTPPASTIEMSFPLNDQEPSSAVDVNKELRSGLSKLSNALVPLVIAHYQTSVCGPERIRCLVILTRICTFLEPLDLLECLRTVPLAGFLSWVFGRQLASCNCSSTNDVQVLTHITYALGLCQILLRKLPDTYQTYFQREGVVHELERLVKCFLCQSDVDINDKELDDIVQKINLGDQPAKETAALLATHQQLTGRWYCHQLGTHAKAFLATFLHLGDQSERSSLSKYQQLSTALGSIDEETSNAALATIVDLFKDENDADGITTFELIQSGLAKSLFQWLSFIDTVPGRRVLFAETFGVSGVLASLLHQLQRCLSRYEAFEVQSSSSSGDHLKFGRNAVNNNPFGFLTRQIRIRVLPAPDVVEKAKSLIAPYSVNAKQSSSDASSTEDEEDGMQRPQSNGLTEAVVSMQTVATFHSLEQFLMPRLHGYFHRLELARMQQPPSENTVAELPDMTDYYNTSTDEDDDDDEDGIGEELAQMAGASFFGRAADRRRRVRHDSSFVETLEGDVETLASQDAKLTKEPPRSQSSKDPVPCKLQFSIGRMAIPLGMTVFGAIHRFESEMRSAETPAEREASVTSNLSSFLLRASSQAARTAADRADYFANTYTVYYRPVSGSHGENLVVPAKDFQEHISPLNIPFEDVFPEILSRSALPSPFEHCAAEPFVTLLQLLAALYKINKSKKPCLQDSLFVNGKITAKLTRQLGDKLAVVTGIVPSWCYAVCSHFPFLVPIESRMQFLRHTGFGLARSLMQMNVPSENSSTPAAQRREGHVTIGRISRQKVRINRDRIFQSALKVMETYGAKNRYLLEVEFSGEVGTGLGPTLEFYALVSEHWQRRDLGIWRDPSASRGQSSDYVQPDAAGLFPRPLAIDSKHKSQSLKYFRMLGRFVAKALFDFRIIDLPLSARFLQHAVFVTNGCTVSEQAARSKTVYELAALVENLSSVDPQLAESLTDLLHFHPENNCSKHPKHGNTLSDLSLDFTLPGYPEIQMIENGADIGVSHDNLALYIEKVVDWTLYRGIEDQLRQFCEGFSCVFPITHLRLLTSDELASVLSSGQWQGPWTRQDLHDNIKVDHGFTADSPTIERLVTLLTEFTQAEQRLFLQFITGSPKLPVGGFKALVPPLTVVRKTVESGQSADSYLPSVMTCVNYLKLPEYSTAEVMRQRLLFAMQEGQGSFHLS